VNASVDRSEGIVHLAAVLIRTARKDPLLGARINVNDFLLPAERNAGAARHGGSRSVRSFERNGHPRWHVQQFRHAVDRCIDLSESKRKKQSGSAGLTSV
jgi:hypothetical protein